MTLIDAILKATAHDEGKYSSPPPELVQSVNKKFKVRRIRKYAHVRAKVDSSPPWYEPTARSRRLRLWCRDFESLYAENVYLLLLIRKAHYLRNLQGCVDSHWSKTPKRNKQYFLNRMGFLEGVWKENSLLYKRILRAKAYVATTSELNRDWSRNRRKIVEHAHEPFVLFSPVPHEEMEDPAFKAAPNVKRPRVYLKLGVRDGAVMGEICVELFVDMCPKTCQLFLELVDGDTLGHGYVKTCFFRKVPKLYWSGGDVIYNNGFGCYAQRSRLMPIGAENYHYPHSMAGLLSMRVTIDDEMCGIFNITFKPMPQLDLRNVVFGRIIRPNTTYNIISGLGNALSTRPVVEIKSTRRKVNGRWVRGKPNTRMVTSYRNSRKTLVE